MQKNAYSSYFLYFYIQKTKKVTLIFGISKTDGCNGNSKPRLLMVELIA